MKWFVGCMGLVLAVSCAPALGTIVVSLTEVSPLTVEVWADIPQSDAILGWGMDLVDTPIDPGADYVISNVAINEGPFDAAFAPDGDGLAALVTPPGTPVWGNVLLATVDFATLHPGLALLCGEDTNPPDLTEGFALDVPPGGFADVTYQCIEIPEPATLALLALGGLLALRRR